MGLNVFPLLHSYFNFANWWRGQFFQSSLNALVHLFNVSGAYLMPASLKPRTVKNINHPKSAGSETDALWLATTVLTTRPWPLWQNKKHQHLQNLQVSPSKLIFLGEENFSNVSEAEKLIGKSNNLNSNLQLQRMLYDDTFSAAEMEPNFVPRVFYASQF